MAARKIMEEDIFSKLLCYECKITNSNQIGNHICKNSRHPLCENCFKKESHSCKESSKTEESKTFINSLLETLPSYCKNFDNGCREIMSENTKEKHQENCEFRYINCPNIECKEKIVYNQLMDHFKSFDKKHVRNSMGAENVEIKKNKIIFKYPDGNLGDERPNYITVHFEINGQIFFLVACLRECRQFVYFYGSPTEAKDLTYTISYKFEKFNFSFQANVLPLDRSYSEIISNEPNFFISNEMLSVSPEAKKSSMILIEIENSTKRTKVKKSTLFARF